MAAGQDREGRGAGAGLAASRFPGVGAPRSWREGVGAGCWVRAAPGRRTREGGLSPRQLAAALELFHFQGAEMALLGGLEAWVYQP